MEEENVIVVGYCECCGNQITTNDEEAYVDENGNYFCSVECVLDHYHITKLEI